MSREDYMISKAFRGLEQIADAYLVDDEDIEKADDSKRRSMLPGTIAAGIGGAGAVYRGKQTVDMHNWLKNVRELGIGSEGESIIRGVRNSVGRRAGGWALLGAAGLAEREMARRGKFIKKPKSDNSK